jgi:hypothetical protein
VVRDEQGRAVAQDRAASVLFHEAATAEEDQFDAPKFEPMASPFATLAPVSADGQTLHAQESRPLPNGSTTTVPVDVRSDGVSGTFRLSIPSGEAATASTETPSLPEDWTVTLVDTKGTDDPADDEQHRLTPGGPAYTFSMSAKSKTAQTAVQTAADTGASSAPPSPPPLRRMERPAPAETQKAGNTAKQAASGPRFRLKVKPSGALPVELADLSVQRREKQAVLNWTTASETGNAGFEVQHQRLPAEDTTTAAGKRSTTPDASDWTDLGFVEGAGTTTEAQSYRFETGSLDYGRHVFRLRQVDTDGTATTTDPVEMQMRLQAAYAVEAPYPNPATQTATLPVTVRDAQRVTVAVYDLLGRRVQVVRDRPVQAQRTNRISLPVRDLASGSYFVRVRGEAFSVTRRLTVVR